MNDLVKKYDYAKTLNLSLLLCAFIPVTKIIAMPALLSERAGRGLWLSAILCFTADVILIIITSTAYKKYKVDFCTAIENSFGKGFAKTMMILYALYFIIKSLVLVLGEKYFMENAYYEETTVSYIFYPFFALCFYLCFKGIKVFEKLSFIFAVFAGAGFVIIILLSFPQSNFQNLMPLSHYSWKGILRGSYLTFSYTGEGLYLLFFLGRHKQGKKVFPISLSAAFAYLLTIFLLLIFYGTFYTLAPCKLFAISQLGHYSRVLSSVGRVDTFAIFMLDLVRLFALCIPLVMASECIGNVIKNTRKARAASALAITVALFVFTLIFSEKNLFVTNLFCKIFTPFYIGITYFLTPILLLASKGEK